MAENLQAIQFASKQKICVWTLPLGSPPAVRVEVTDGTIIASRLLEIVCDTLGIHRNSRPFFGLFKGIDPPIKKYGEEEVIYTPCQRVISVLKWSFDPIEEARAIKTDTVSIRLLALQIKADITAGRFSPTSEEQDHLEKLLEPKFPCYKQYVDFARSIPSYETIMVRDGKLLKSVRLITQTLKRGSKLDIACNSKRMIIITETKELHIPWRKVRRWTQVSDNATIAYEIYLMEEKAFTWIEIETVQARYLLQVTSELVGRLNDRLQKADQKQSRCVRRSPKKKKLTWELFKQEVFGSSKNENPELPSFDNLEDIPSSEEENEIAIVHSQKKSVKLSKKAETYQL